ncbi:hypothetical protein GCM10023165_19790 [Variovorax defluvii]|uniref:Uncharacterized protein n=1 Tax=Variovorax defluvii TaxID=913761 RepID=A0ABP8HJ42_9BURK
MTTPSTRQKLRQRLYLKEYLKELAALTGRPVQCGDLLSLEQTADLQAARQKCGVEAAVSTDILFSDRGSERFGAFLRRLHDANPSAIYVWTPRTIDCGALLVPSLSAIQWGFDFAVNEEGILAFVTSDLADRLLLDFSELPTDEQRMKIEIQGPNWGSVAY